MRCRRADVLRSPLTTPMGDGEASLGGKIRRSRRVQVLFNERQGRPQDAM